MFFNYFLSTRLDELIERFFDAKEKADLLLEKYFKQHHIGKRDRTWLRSNFYYYLRHRDLIDFLTSGAREKRSELIARMTSQEPDSFLQERLDAFHQLDHDVQRQLDCSMPPWISARYAAQFDEQPQWLNTTAETTIRINPRKTSRRQLIDQLHSQDICCRETAVSPLGLIVEKNEQQLTKTTAFAEGLFEMQDEGSQLLMLLLNKTHRSLLDACAGGGGKSITAALFHPNMQITATDIRTYKFQHIMERASRAGITAIATAPLSEIHGKLFDTVMIDAPCSGLGVLRRNPDDRWRISKDDIPDIVAQQRQCLDSYCALVKPGGELLYITCSFLDEENESQISHFLAAHPEFAPLHIGERLHTNISTASEGLSVDGCMLRTTPGFSRDLFFAAVLKKT